MRDHYYIDDAGGRTAVADLPTETIQELLQDQLYVENAEPGETVEAVRARLQLELEIRAKGF